MRVAIDEQIFALQRHGGISRLFYELISQYRNNPDFNVQVLPFDRPIISEYVIRDVPLRDYLNATASNRTITGLFKQAAPGKFDKQAQIVHHTFYLPPGLYRYKQAKRIVTVYDMIPEIMQHTKRRLDFATRKRKFLEAADHVTCISQSTLNDVKRIWPDLQVPMSVTHLGVNPAFTPTAVHDQSLPENYILHVGNRADYKDAWTLTQSFQKLAPEFPDLKLLYVGGGKPTPAEQAQWGSNIQWLQAPETQLPSIYAQARLCVVPSRYEGFGLPALEGLASGTPQILSDTSSLLEVGGSAARHFTPGSIPQLTDLISEVLTNPQLAKEMSDSGLEQAKKFTWYRYAQATADVYAKTLD
ncbi:MAG: glycosyltransferase family 1 protein [Candidatus Nanopelagicales bacterium]|nr:glycosyltransferase family 1 protein [Candidatus Nanopelagicales bacterium]